MRQPRTTLRMRFTASVLTPGRKLVNTRCCLLMAFLGFTFRPRKAMSKQHRVFTSFLPGVSTDAVKRMRKVVRGWRIPRQTPATLAELAKQYNSVIRGWWEYYGAFYQTAMRGLFRYVDSKLEQWARRKY